MGDSAPEKVKLKIVEMLYSWTIAFPNETKISEAYQTLRRQGVLRCGWNTATSLSSHFISRNTHKTPDLKESY